MRKPERKKHKMPRNETCPDCGKKYRYSVSDRYRYAESGLENVYLEDVETIACGCGESLAIRALPSLLRVIAMCFAYKPARLRGNELRFVRHVTGGKAKDFAETLSITPEHLSRLENGAGVLPAGIDKLVRAHTALDLISNHRAIADHFDTDKLLEILEQSLRTDDDTLALFVRYVGPYIGADDKVEFEFKKAA